MRRVTVVKPHWLLAVLIAALLGGMAHAAEFGAGAHYHDGVACSFGLSSDDDHALARPALQIDAPVSTTETLSCQPRSIDALNVALLPPATGPPKNL